MSMDNFQILIVDNDPVQLKLLTGQLIETNQELRLLIATTGKSAVEIALQSQPDLIVLNWDLLVTSKMQGINEFGTNNWNNPIPVIATSRGSSSRLTVNEVLERGAVDFLSGEYDVCELVARIRAQIRQISLFRDAIAAERQANKSEREGLEKTRIILHKELHQLQKQLTTHNVHITQQNELLQSVSHDLRTILPFVAGEGRKIIHGTILRIKNKNNDNLWNEFEVCFEKVHDDFYKRLVAKLPGITVREKRLCAYLRLNLSSKEIASLTYQSQNAIDVAKHRLRKKIGLQTDTDFSNFLIAL